MTAKAVVGFAVLGSLYYSKIVDYGLGLCAGRPILWPDMAKMLCTCDMSSVQNLCWLMIIGDYTTQCVGIVIIQ